MPSPKVGDVALKLNEPVAIVVQRMPEEKHDYSGDVATGLFGLFGVLVGAGISIVTNWLVKRSEESSKNRYALFTMTRKIQRIYSVLNVLHGGLMAGINSSKLHDEKFLFPRVLSSSNSFADIRYDPEEFWRVKSLTTPEFIDNIALLDDHYNGLLSVMQKYGNEREIIVNQLVDICPPGGEGYAIDYNREDIKPYLPKFEALDRMIRNIVDGADDDRRRAHSALIDLHKAMGKLTGKNTTISLTSPEGVVEKIGSLD